MTLAGTFSWLIIALILLHSSTAQFDNLLDSEIAGDEDLEFGEDADQSKPAESSDSELFSFKLKVKSFRDCKNKNDLISLKKLFYNRTISVPGNLEFNSSLVVKEKLPSDWNIKTEVHVKTTWLGWIRIPHTYDKKFKNMCSETRIEKCKNITRKYSMEKICKCDMEPGTYDFPSMEIPLKMKEKKGEHLSFRKSILKKYLTQVGAEFRIESVLTSADNGKRFGCFRGQFVTI